MTDHLHESHSFAAEYDVLNIIHAWHRVLFYLCSVEAMTSTVVSKVFPIRILLTQIIPLSSSALISCSIL